MTLIQRIPLSADTTDQRLSVSLGGNPYILRVLWNERFGYFSLSVLTSDDAVILENIKMVKNYPLTSRYKDTRLPFGGFYFIQEKGYAYRPGYDDLAVNFNLYYYEADAEITAQPVREQITAAIIGTVFDDGATPWDSGATLWDQ